MLFGLAAIFLLHSGLIASAKSEEEQTVKPWSQKRKIWFDNSAHEWKVALPVGNGRLGAMVLGTYPKERIQLNEDTIWAKEPMLRQPSSTKEAVDKVQELVNAGKYAEAHKLYETDIIIEDCPRIGSYQTLGDLWIEHVGSADLKTEGYYRELDLARA